MTLQITAFLTNAVTGVYVCVCLCLCLYVCLFVDAREDFGHYYSRCLSTLNFIETGSLTVLELKKYNRIDGQQVPVIICLCHFSAGFKSECIFLHVCCRHRTRFS